MENVFKKSKISRSNTKTMYRIINPQRLRRDRGK